MRDFMQKKAVTELLFLFELIIAAIVIVAMIGVAKNTVSAGKISEKFLAKDAALMIDTLHAVPGNAIVYYKTANYTNPGNLFVLSGNLKLGSGADAGDLMSLRQPYRESEAISIGENNVALDSEKPNTVIFVKEGSVLSIRKGEESK